MPIDVLDEVVGAALDAAGSAIAEAAAPKRGRFRRVVYWSIVLLVGAFVIGIAALFLS
ncbi:MAG TPA: hypothetical protein VI168_00910 [Croceibacterium sp.]